MGDWKAHRAQFRLGIVHSLGKHGSMQLFVRVCVFVCVPAELLVGIILASVSCFLNNWTQFRFSRSHSRLVVRFKKQKTKQKEKKNLVRRTLSRVWEIFVGIAVQIEWCKLYMHTNILGWWAECPKVLFYL